MLLESAEKLQETVIGGCPAKNLTVGDKLHLRCGLAELQPNVSFRWVRIGRSTMNIKAETPDAGELLIRSVAAADSGTYECQAYNIHTNEIVASGDVTVIVQSKLQKSSVAQLLCSKNLLFRRKRIC